MRVGKLTIAALAWASLGVLSARAEKLVEVKQQVQVQEVQVEIVQKDGKMIKVVRGGAQGGDSKATATSSDPAEPVYEPEVGSLRTVPRAQLETSTFWAARPPRP